jgi:two-component system, cell cycle response regulator
MLRHNRIQAELDSESMVDELTGLYNKQGFWSIAQQLVKLAARSKREVLLVFADLKGLRKINETFGDDAGDLALVKTADLLQETFRKSDVISYLGGETFVVITIETRKDSGEIIANRLREKVDKYNTATLEHKLSLSVNVQSLDPERISIEEIIAKAEKRSNSIEI